MKYERNYLNNIEDLCKHKIDTLLLHLIPQPLSTIRQPYCIFYVREDSSENGHRINMFHDIILYVPWNLRLSNFVTVYATERILRHASWRATFIIKQRYRYVRVTIAVYLINMWKTIVDGGSDVFTRFTFHGEFFYSWLRK